MHDGSTNPESQTTNPPSILIIGGGHMGMALAQCWRDGFEGLAITLAETDAARRQVLASHGFHAPEELELPDDGFDAVVLAIKPQGFTALAPQLADIVGEATLISIMAGIPIAALQQITPHAVRVMPNLPVTIGEGMSALCAPALAAERQDFVQALMEATGAILWVEDEAQLHAITAVSGSGPAYLFAFMEAFIQAAEQQGLDTTTARRLVTHTMRGAALLAEAQDGDVTTLRQQVTSPGGTTQAALEQFSVGGLQAMLSNAVKSARVRSEALANSDT